MLIRHLLGAITLSVISVSALAANTLALPDQADVLVVDGKDAKDSVARLSKDSVQLENGKHQVVFQFNALLKGNSDSSMYTSKPYIATFTLSGDQAYQFQMPKFRNIKDAEKFAKTPSDKLTLVDSKGNKVPYQFAVLQKRGMQLGRDLVEETRKFNLSSDPAALYALTGATHVTSQVPVVQGENKELAVMAENNLKYWFMQSDKETRTRFLKWANEQ